MDAWKTGNDHTILTKQENQNQISSRVFAQAEADKRRL
jgi:hypothetical protein